MCVCVLGLWRLPVDSGSLWNSYSGERVFGGGVWGVSPAVSAAHILYVVKLGNSTGIAVYSSTAIRLECSVSLDGVGAG